MARRTQEAIIANKFTSHESFTLWEDSAKYRLGLLVCSKGPAFTAVLEAKKSGAGAVYTRCVAFTLDAIAWPLGLLTVPF